MCVYLEARWQSPEKTKSQIANSKTANNNGFVRNPLHCKKTKNELSIILSLVILLKYHSIKIILKYMYVFNKKIGK